MIDRILRGAGFLALATLVGGSFVALAVVRGRIQVHIEKEEDAARRGPDPTQVLLADVADVKGELSALVDALQAPMARIHDAIARAAELETADAERWKGLDRRLLAIEARLESSPPVREPDAPDVPPHVEVSTPIDAPVSAPEAEGGAPPAGRGFLSFQIPSRSFAFEGRQRLSIVPSLSRVGFDAKSTLHDFSGVSDRVEGELVVDLSRPEHDGHGEVRVGAASLVTGLDDRDAEMREHLGTDSFPTLRFAWTSFSAEAVDREAMTVLGTARGTLTIRDVERAVAVPVRVSVDASKRVVIEGESRIRMSDFGVQPPSKLGVVRVEDQVSLWVALRARSLGPAPEASAGN